MKENSFITPVGRLVQGSVSEPNTTDMAGNLLVTKKGDPRNEYFVALAIPKCGESHWRETAWGGKIYGLAKSFFPNGQIDNPNFHWKIVDGDSTIPNNNNKRPCDCAGFQNSWILKLKHGFPLILCDKNGKKENVTPEMFSLGNYAQGFVNVASNGQQIHSGIYLNCPIVSFTGYGAPIILSPDTEKLGFGQEPLPDYVKQTPVSVLNAEVVNTDSPQSKPSAYSPQFTQVEQQPAPYPQILSVPPAPLPPSVTSKIMIGDAAGTKYQDWIDANWTDALLIQHGRLSA